MGMHRTLVLHVSVHQHSLTCWQLTELCSMFIILGCASVQHHICTSALCAASDSTAKSWAATIIPVCSGQANDFQWRLVNGLWGLILALGLLWTALAVRKARSWLYFRGWIRSFLADYGVPLLVIVWSAVGYCVYRGTPMGVPRQAIIYNTWDVKNNWAVARVSKSSLSVLHLLP